MFDREWILSIARQRLARRPEALARLELELMLGGGNLPAAIFGGAFADQEHDRFLSAAAGLSSLPTSQRCSTHLVAALDRWADTIPAPAPPLIQPLASGGASQLKRIKEAAAARRDRRLKRFLELGGHIRSAGSGCQFLPRGLVPRLAREEQAKGHLTKSDPRELRKDLIEAYKSSLKRN